MGRRNEPASLVDASQFEPPKGYKLDGLKLYKANTKDADLSAIYNPAPLNVLELRLTALGGSLRHDSSFIPPAGAVRADGRNVFDAFSVERWRQITVLGRDIEVEVVYKGVPVSTWREGGAGQADRAPLRSQRQERRPHSCS